MPPVISDSYFAPCGMNCWVCYAHLKPKKACCGCLNQDAQKPERCKTCQIKRCVAEKGLHYCYQCKEFPCKQIQNIDKSYLKQYKTSLIANSKKAQKYGITVFLSEEHAKWKCPFCAGIISLHDQRCPNSLSNKP